MMHYYWADGSWSTMGGIGMLLYMAIAAFIFSLIFWYTYKLVIKNDRKR